LEGDRSGDVDLRSLPPAQAAARGLPDLRHLQRPSGRRGLIAAVPTSPEVLGAVVAALARVLEREARSIGPDDSLGDLGADSLVRVEVAELVEQALAGRVQITDEHLDEAPTVAMLAAAFRTTSTAFTSTGGDG
jgi:acyl carrier protein